MDRKLLFARACTLQIESIDRRKDRTFALAIVFFAATVFAATCASVAGLASSDLLQPFLNSVYPLPHLLHLLPQRYPR